MGARQHEGVRVQPLRRILVFAIACGGAPSLRADLPSARLSTVSPAGGKIGTTFDVALGGSDLDGATALLFSHPGITAVPKLEPPGPLGLDPEPIPGRFTVTIAPDVPAGVHEARASGKNGLSNPRAFAVGSLAEAFETEPNDRVEQAFAASAVPIETVVNGAAGGGADVDCFRFAAKAGQRVIIDCWAERIDSRLDAVLVLLDAGGREIDRSHDASRRDPFIDFTAPGDGEFAVKVHDFLYGGSPEHFYRLVLSSAPRIDFVLPPAGVAGAKGKFTIYGRNLPGSEPAEGVQLAGKTLERLAVEIELPGADAAQAIAPGAWPVGLRGAFLDGAAVRLPGIDEPLLIYFAPAPVTLEAEPNDEPARAMKLSVPAEVAGRFHPSSDQDWFAFEAAAGDVYWIEVFAERLGRAADPYLLVQQVVRNDKGEEQVKDLQGTDDLGGDVGGPGYGASTSDPAYRFAAPGAGTYRVMVKDLAGGSSDDPRNVYRLVIRKESPDFRLVAVPRSAGANREELAVSSLFLRRGGTETIDVLVFRRDGFGSAIEVAVEGLPSWVSCPGATIGSGRTSGTLVLRASADAPEWRGRIRVSGRAGIGEFQVVRAARFGAVTWPGPRAQAGAAPRLVRDLALAVTAEEAPFLVEPANGAVFEMSRAGTLEVPVNIVRRGEFKGKVALAAVDLPPNVDAEAFELDGNATTGVLKLKVKRDAPTGAYTMHLRAASQVSYRRDPEGAAAAAARKARLEKLAADLAAAAKTTAESKAAADKGAEEAAQADEKAAQALQAAPAESKAAAEAVKSAAGEVKRLADLVKAAVDRTAAEADARAKAAADLAARAAKQAQDAAKAANPANVDVALASAPFTVRITEAPITLEVSSPITIQRGAKLEVPVAITRRHGFSDPVQVSLVLPGGASGIGAREAAIAAGETKGTIAIEAAADAATGRRAANIRAALKWNGQDLQSAREVSLVVEEAK